MARAHPITSYFNPASHLHHALDDIKMVKKREKAVIIALTILTALFSLPVAGCTAVAVFRRLTELYKPKEPTITVTKIEEVVVRIIEKATKDVEEIIVTKEPPPPRQSPRLKAKKGHIVRMIGRERLEYWCPKVGAVAGIVVGFFGTNLAANYGIFFTRSQTAQAEVYTTAQEKLSTFIVDDLVKLSDAQGDAIAQELALAREVNIESQQVLQNVVTQLAQKAASTSAATVLSREGLRVAASFAQAASHGDVPLNFLSIHNYIGAAAGGYIGYTIGKRIVIWLDQ